MAYTLQLSENEVLHYFRTRGDLSRSTRIRIFTVLHSYLGEQGDHFRNDPTLRLAPGSDCFRFDVVVRSDEEDGLRLFRFVVSDREAEYGVLRVLFVEEV